MCHLFLDTGQLKTRLRRFWDGHQPAPGENHGTKAVSRETHGEALDGDRIEVEESGVQLDGAQSAGSDDHLQHREVGLECSPVARHQNSGYLDLTAQQ
jgi:hypothetical protein